VDSEKNQFVHDLRNPLNTISINAELGKLTLERTGDIRKAISIFDTILAECRQCSHVLETWQDTQSKRVNNGSSESNE
jgi:signal transduction histidine kinase